MLAGFPELNRLISEVIDHPIDLLNHCFGQNFNFDSDLNCGNFSSGYRKSLISNWSFTRNNLAESAVPSSGSDSLKSISGVQKQDARLNRTHELGRLIDGNKVLVELHRYEITLIG